MKTAIVILLDKSGSMASLRNEVISEFNQFIQKQKEIVNDEDLFYMAQFSSELVVTRDWTSISTVEELTKEDYNPGGFTRFYSSMNDVIESAGQHFNSLTVKPDKVLFVAITDGRDNVSSPGSKETLIQKMKHQSEKYGWDFSFMGSNFDVEKESQSIGIRAGNTKSFDFNSRGLAVGMSSLTLGVSAYRSSKEVKNIYDTSITA